MSSVTPPDEFVYRDEERDRQIMQTARDNLTKLGFDQHQFFINQQFSEYVETKHLTAILTGCMVAVLKVTFPIPIISHVINPLYPQNLNCAKGSYHQSYFFNKELAEARLNLYCELHVPWTATIHLFWTNNFFQKEVSGIKDGNPNLSMHASWWCELTCYEAKTSIHNRKKCTKAVPLQIIPFTVWTDWRDLVGLEAQMRALSEK